jgi:hypothetical protein
VSALEQISLKMFLLLHNSVFCCRWFMWPEIQRTHVCLTTTTVRLWKAIQAILKTSANFLSVDPVSKMFPDLLLSYDSYTLCTKGLKMHSIFKSAHKSYVKIIIYFNCSCMWCLIFHIILIWFSVGSSGLCTFLASRPQFLETSWWAQYSVSQIWRPQAGKWKLVFAFLWKTSTSTLSLFSCG